MEKKMKTKTKIDNNKRPKNKIKTASENGSYKKNKFDAKENGGFEEKRKKDRICSNYGILARRTSETCERS
jgi:hypothetical protein